jgi:hypothetical protein
VKFYLVSGARWVVSIVGSSLALTLVLFAGAIVGALMAGVIVWAQQTWRPPADRDTAWNPGLDIPDRQSVCAVLSTGSSPAQAQAAINACPPGQVVQLAAGVYTWNDHVLINRGVTLRGAGPTTILRKTNGAKPGFYAPPDVQEIEPVIIIGPNRWPGPDDSTAKHLSEDGVKGSRTVSVGDSQGFAAGQLVLIDEDHYGTATYRAMPTGTMKVLASDRVVWQKHDPGRGGDDPMPEASGWFSRLRRPIAEVKEIASVSVSSVTFTTPLHISYRTSHFAQLVRYNAQHVKGAGVEDLRVEGGSDGAIRFEAASESWAKNVDCAAWLGECVSIAHSFRVELRDSYIHDATWPSPGGGGYAISLAKGTSEVLIENNIVRQTNKVMVARSAGAGSVVGYNYMDDGLIQGDPSWQEVGINGSHMAGPHHMLFEGNLSFNYDSDNTHGSAIYHTVFRNHLTGFRKSYPGLSNGRAAGLAYGSWWHTFAGNVLGTSGKMSGWLYEDTVPWPGPPAIWRLGYEAIGWPAYRDPNVLATVIREGNWDYVRNQRDTTATLPSSLYLSSKPAFFGACVWPWVTPEGTTKTYTLPAKARHDGTACGTPPTPTPSPTATPSPTPTPTATPTPTPSPAPVVTWTCTTPRVTTTTTNGKRRYVVDRGTCTGQEQ